MKFLPVLRQSVPSQGRNITEVEFRSLSICGVGTKRAAAVQIRRDGSMFVRDTAGREHNVGRRV